MVKYLFLLLMPCFLLAGAPAFSQTSGTTYKNLPPLAFQQELSRRQGIVLDVRTPAEFAQGHLPGAINLDFYAPDFQEKLKAYATGRPVLVYCAVGGRSAKAAQYLQHLKAPQVYNLAGGYQAWVKAGLPVKN